MNNISKKSLVKKSNQKGINIFFLYWKKCPFCKKSFPLIDFFSDKYNNFNFYWVEVDEENMWDDKGIFSVEVVPTLIIFKDSKNIYKKTHFLSYFDLNTILHGLQK